MLDTKLIISSLELTGKTMEDMYIDSYKWHHKVVHTIWDKSLTLEDFDIVKPIFLIEKFCYYLLSPEFIEKYQENCINDFESYTDIVLSELFWRALYLYQLWQKHHLIELLSKIK